MIQKVLVIRFRRVGDSVLATALCRSLKESFPGVEVHFVLNAGIAPLYEGHPDIDKVIAFTDEEQHGMAYLRKVWQTVRATRYDAIIDMRSTPKTLPFALFSPGTPYRIGRRKPYNAGVHNYRLENPSGVDRVQTNLNLMTPLAREGQLVMNPHFRLVITEEERRSFRSYMAREGVDFGRPVVLCAVTARLAYKVWPYERMARVLRRLIDSYDAQLVFNYAGDVEAAAARALRDMLGGDSRVVLGVQAKGLRELCAMTVNADLFFGNEGGPRHIAQALGVPTLALFPPGVEKWFWLPGADDRQRGLSPDDYLAPECQQAMTYAQRFDLIPEEDVWAQLADMMNRYVVKP